MGKRELRVYAFPGAVLDDHFLPHGTVLVADPRDPDLVALATASRSPTAVQRQIVRARRRFGWRPLLVAHYGEIAAEPAANLADLDAVFSFAPTGGGNTRHERYWRSPHLAAHITARAALAPDGLWARPKTRFCNFVYSNGATGDTAVREHFARLLMRRGRVDCAGAALTNTFPLPPNEPGSDAGALAKLDYIAAYRFTIAFENVSADHYVTEKLLHALLAGSIPVYWGCPQVAEYYNPDAFVNCHAFDSFEDAVQRVLALEADPDRREAMRRAPMLRDGSRIPALHADLEARWRALAEAVVARRGWRPGRGEERRRWAALLRRSARLGLDPRRLGAPGARLAGLGRRTAAGGAAALRTAAVVACAGAAQAREEALHVRGPRTAAGYLHWLGGRVRWALGRGVGAGVPAASPTNVPAAVWRFGDCGVPDVRLDNPVGWTANVERRVLALGPLDRLPAGALARRAVGCGERVRLGHGHHVEDVAAFHAGPEARAGTLARLAMRGVPVHVLDDDPILSIGLGARLYDLMRAGVPDGIDGREAFSIRMRRMALRNNTRAPWPTVSVLLATRRPERLAHALRSVAAQKYMHVELVLALHGDGFGDVPELPRRGLKLRVVRVGAERPLGAVLDAATAAASGDLLAKMDDDDCYGPEHLLDLVLARAYSGAVLVGKGPEVVYLAGADVTVRRGRWRAERYTSDIAGGGLLISRDDLARVGGWRALPRGVDQALAADVVAAGGAVYRTHGSGFVLVRHRRGHAWCANEAAFRTGADRVSPGWRPDLAGIGDVPCPPC